jgi:hypothetical protein
MATQMPVVVLDRKKIEEIQTSVPQLLIQAQELTVENVEDFVAAGSLLNVIDARKKSIFEFFEEPAKQANNVHKFITSLRTTLVSPLLKAETLMKDRRRYFRAEEERKRLEKEEAERQAAKAEQEQRALQHAAEMESIGEHEAADFIIDQAAAAPPPPVVVPSTIPKEQGHSFRKVWKFRVTNPALHKKEFLILDESKAQAIVSKLGPDAAAIVGGIEVYSEEQEIVRGRKNG